MQSTQESLARRWRWLLLAHLSYTLGTDSAGCRPTQGCYRQGTCATHFPTPLTGSHCPVILEGVPNLLKSFMPLKTLHYASAAVGSLRCSSQLYLGSPGGHRVTQMAASTPSFFSLPERLMKAHFWAKASKSFGFTR